MMNIPALIGVKMDLEALQSGVTAVVDGFQGMVTFDPDEETKAQTETKIQEEAEKLKLLQELKGKENITLDGRKINIYANIGSVGDIGYVMEMMPAESDFSEVNSCILEETISLLRRNSSRLTSRQYR